MAGMDAASAVATRFMMQYAALSDAARAEVCAAAPVLDPLHPCRGWPLIPSRPRSPSSLTAAQYDPRDVRRVKEELGYVARFVRAAPAGGADAREAAFAMLVRALTWRHEYGANDIKEEELATAVVCAGVMFFHGHDLQGRRVLVVRSGRAQACPAQDVQKLLVLHLEQLGRASRQDRMCILLDLQFGGVASVAAGFDEFLAECFNVRYPAALGTLLVLEPAGATKKSEAACLQDLFTKVWRHL